jgi:hypothetical protein
MMDSDPFLTQEVGGETFLVDQRTGRYFRFGGTGAEVWAQLVSGASVERAAEIVCLRTGAPRDEVVADVARFHRDLLDLGLLEPWAGARDPEDAGGR